MKLEQMYQEVILDHYKHPQHAGLRDPYNAEVHHVNTSGGDEVTLRADGEQAEQSLDALASLLERNLDEDFRER